MGRSIRQALIAASAVLFMSIIQRPAVADHQSDLYCAADRYRDAVVEFERLIRKTRYVENCDERLADDLEDSTSRLRSAARDPRRIDRLERYAAETNAYHHRVELVFFGIGKYPPNPRWDACWVVVSRAHQNLFEQLRCICSGLGGLDPRSSCGVGRSIDPYRHSLQRNFYRNALPQTYGFQNQQANPTPFGAGVAVPQFGQLQTSPQQRTPQTFSPGQAALRYQRSFPPTASLPPAPSIIDPAARSGARERSDLRANDFDLSRRTISTPEQLRNAVIGALLQRR